jgi:hypothetical protein
MSLKMIGVRRVGHFLGLCINMTAEAYFQRSGDIDSYDAVVDEVD